TLDGSQTNQNSATASPGTYTGYTERSCCSSIHFTVASGSSTIDNVSIPSTSLACSPAEPNLSSAVTIASIPINSDGSFSSTTTQTGLVGNQPATITFTFDGYVHGPNTSGDSRINGIWREDITYADNGTSYYCTTNNQSYRAVWTSG
ncbi:MAG TPA: hypothetical protein VE088_00590, partial [Gaiellaceae bacterium]|nr:hypothetical protein [Gaiellaceae bacterium]